jgi:DNA-binding MarR family transcriptional regulator
MSPGELARTLGVDRAILRPQLRALEQRGIIVSTGVTASRRVALAPVKRAPAKEVP